MLSGVRDGGGLLRSGTAFMGDGGRLHGRRFLGRRAWGLGCAGLHLHLLAGRPLGCANEKEKRNMKQTCFAFLHGSSTCNKVFCLYMQ